MKKFLTLDVGTTAVKAALFDSRLSALGVIIKEYRLITPSADIVELPAVIYWDNALLSIAELLRVTNTAPEDIATITCTTQGETIIPIDKNGVELHNALVWLDSRAKDESGVIAKLFTKEEFYKKTGISEVNPYCPVAKLLWIKNNRPELYAKTYKFLLLEDYLIFKLTGKAVTNPAVSCTTGYFDIAKNKLWQEMFEATGLDEGKIPEMHLCATIVANLSVEAAHAAGLSESTLVTTGAMDQVASAIGSANIKNGVVSETTGTCLGVVACTDDPKLNDWSTISVYSHAVEGLYLRVVITQTAGMILKWFRNEFCHDLNAHDGDIYSQMSMLAAKEPVLSRGLMLLPYLTGLEANSNARGVFLGVGLDTNRGCFIRAVMEAVGYMLKESIDSMGLTPACINSLGGGAKSEVWNQIKADICNTVINVMETEESSLLGAAILGGIAVGEFKDMQEACNIIAEKKKYNPAKKNLEQYSKGYKKFRCMCAHMVPTFD